MNGTVFASIAEMIRERQVSANERRRLMQSAYDRLDIPCCFAEWRKACGVREPSDLLVK